MLYLCTDSWMVANALWRWLQQWKQSNWQCRGKPIWAAPLWQDIAARLEKLVVKVCHVDAHVPKRWATEEHQNNQQVDQAAKIEVAQVDSDWQRTAAIKVAVCAVCCDIRLRYCSSMILLFILVLARIELIFTRSQDSSHIMSPIPPVSSPPLTSKIKEFADNENFDQDLCTFLISQACKNSTLANYLYWYVIVEWEDQDTQQRDPKTHEMYLNVMRRFSQALLKGDKSVRVMCSFLAAQQTFIDHLVHVMKAMQHESGNRKKKITANGEFLFHWILRVKP
ncbi:phosphatidylinositol 3-kinase catalytic subunit type 3 [Grus japonensis]|uniref:Phosphatidylinositol 3-kinase catalytic subunit type 3 n=1 Tax=Grus japonensis TaxID=30415 RepID=A0ABC9YG90_GRUJA